MAELICVLFSCDSLSGCDKLSRPGAALGLAGLTQLVDLDLSYIGATPPDDEDVETARELQAGLNGIGYSTWVSVAALKAAKASSADRHAEMVAVLMSSCCYTTKTYAVPTMAWEGACFVYRK